MKTKKNAQKERLELPETYAEGSMGRYYRPKHTFRKHVRILKDIVEAFRYDTLGG